MLFRSDNLLLLIVSVNEINRKIIILHLPWTMLFSGLSNLNKLVLNVPDVEVKGKKHMQVESISWQALFSI